MILDAGSLPNGKDVKTDVCIVGAGIAGITLAREFVGKDIRVCLLESGGFEPDKVTQSLYWGENTGFPYYPLDTARARFFGGTSHYWNIPLGDELFGVRLRPLDPIDFEEREWVPYSGWPFRKEHLDPFYERAQSVCKIGPFTYDVKEWEDPVQTPRLPLLNGRVKTTMFQFASRDLFFSKYRNEISSSDMITAFLHANVTDIETNRTAGSVTRLRIAGLNGKKFYLSAKLFILALGAIETPRLLMLSNKIQKTGLGNQNDLVGRFFMEHPHLWSGMYIPSNESIFRNSGLYGIHKVKGVPVMGKLTLSEEVIRQERILNYVASIHPKMCPAPVSATHAEKKASLPVLKEHTSGNLTKHLGSAAADIGSITKKVFRKIRDHRKIKVFLLNHMSEQLPNPDSRVMLGEECDALGQRRVNLDWRMMPLDMRTIIRGQEIIDEELRHAGLGRLHIEMQDDSPPPPQLTGGWHHMGTTRMHVDPKKGVVDDNCRVHGIGNLFIAGPSVFPTGGYANPVLTIIAMAVRLADHVKGRMTGKGGS